MNRDTAPSRLPADYVHEHVRLGYAATEHGYQSDTVDHSLALVSAVTTRRGLYVAATRGRDDNLLCVVTDSDDVAEARDILEAILAFDRADIPAVTQRRTLAHQQPAEAWRQASDTDAVAVRSPSGSNHSVPGCAATCTTPSRPSRRARRGGLDLQPRPPPPERDLVRIEAATAPARQSAGGGDEPLRGGVAAPRPRPAPPRPQRHPRPTGRPPRP